MAYGYFTELKGGINVVAGVPGRGRNLVFLARGDIINAAQTDWDLRDFPASGGGLISLIGSTGEVAWYIHFSRTPHTMDCSLIDVTGDGAEDCIVVGTGKLLVAVNPIPGMTNLSHLQVCVFSFMKAFVGSILCAMKVTALLLYAVTYSYNL
jgi:hypothetical protein